MTPTISKKHARAQMVWNTLEAQYPDVGTFLTHDSSFQLLIAVILSAQCTDERVNRVTPKLFAAYPTASLLAKADLQDIKEHIKSVNYFHNKARNIKKTSQILMNTYKGEVPSSLVELVTLPGVGRKTANVVRGQAFGEPGITVDTHVKRVTYRLGLTAQKNPEKVEYDLMKVWPADYWTPISSMII
ncbi:MAG: endonuclease III, partial [Candidatus Margulisbacteria bacterium]|nr:endonuclease III [Candidatus Margulisiibacteriota bacterium]